ncbi:hypothetical protein [Lacticaseibacillus absianus]|uniref:hypothetical protein n=1 Tax=Lacticaseibacillus absianus TaxID=2729623 RepID=UPI0015C7DDAC|nr:hypothetical protein [Lacticaseibacillus absianus]
MKRTHILILILTALALTLATTLTLVKATRRSDHQLYANLVLSTDSPVTDLTFTAQVHKQGFDRYTLKRSPTIDLTLQTPVPRGTRLTLKLTGATHRLYYQRTVLVTATRHQLTGTAGIDAQTLTHLGAGLPLTLTATVTLPSGRVFHHSEAVIDLN